ncbi:hypothetical protein ACO2Q0_04830 [Phenylobacterium sp. VNQ135]|uniref:hypothetical protein n=1 Tax=Phenylobacterium sp. VNQ135 TaxID=3400922 RepID=UPI003C00D018
MLRTWDRWLAGALALALGANGLAMLFNGLAWYGAVPGVTSTGPYNAHFVRDIGAAYLVAALGLAWFAWKPREGWPALAAGAAFLTVHAAIHVYDATCGASPLDDVKRDFVGVYLFAALPLALALFRKPAHD